MSIAPDRFGVPVVVILLFTILSCNLFDADDHRSPTDPGDGPLTIEAAGDAKTLPADGVSTLEIIARIAAEATKDKRVIHFTTTGGSFEGAATSGTTMHDVAPDVTGRARTLLRSSSIVGPVLVTAQVKDDGNLVDGVARLQIEFRQPDVPPVTLSTAGGVTTLTADGFSVLEIHARISPADANNGRKVSFATSGGTFLGPSGDVAPNAAGVASALLQSSTVVGPVVVTAQIKSGDQAIGAAATLQLEFVAADPSEIIRFVETVGSAPADGATATRLSVRVASSLRSDQRTVTFRTTAGSFTAEDPPDRSETATAGADGLASILLYSPKLPTLALIFAEVAGFEATMDLQFVAAPAERIVVTTDKFTLRQNESANVEVILIRTVGVPSQGTSIEPVAKDAIGTSFGVFSGDRRSDASGKVTLVFRPDGGGTPGRAMIRVTAEGSMAEGVVEFELAPPAPPPS